MSAVWVVRNGDDNMVGVGLTRLAAIDDADFGGNDQALRELALYGSNGPFDGYTVAREMLLTDAYARILEQAGRWAYARKHFPLKREECDEAEDLIKLLQTWQGEEDTWE